MAVVPNFLQNLSSEQVRQSILDIDDSYNNDWDILAELLQNSVDAIRKVGNNEGVIKIKVDCQNNSISVTDNGVGIDAEKLPKLISMFGTDKKNDEASIGEKGVGLKFAIFSCNDFYLRTGNSNGTSYARVKDAASWKQSTEDYFIPLEYDKLDEKFQGTEVYLNLISEDHFIFNLTLNQLKFVVRTKTAIGNTNVLWNIDDITINVQLTYIDPEGKITTETIPFKYWLPIEGTRASDEMNLFEFYDYVKEADRTDAQKRNKLKNKVVYWTKNFPVANRDIKAFCCVVPSRSTWETLNKSLGLASQEILDDEEMQDKVAYSMFQPGIYMSVKGMPTGITIEPPITGSQGSWGQILLLLEDRKLKFDIGRKSIHGKTKSLYKEKARAVFNEYRLNVIKYVAGAINTETSNWDKDEIFAEIESLVDIKSKLTKFVKSPKDQESSVVGLFFEAIGSGIISEIRPLISGYKNKYDLYAYWGNRKVVIEFKSTLYRIMKDWNDAQKMFSEINCIVCWGITELDEQVFKDDGIELEIIEPEGLINKNLKKFPNATHTLRLSGLIDPIYVIDMKIVLEA